MGEDGNGLRSRGSRVRIPAAAPKLRVVEGGGARPAPADPGAHLDRLPAPEEWRPVVGWEGRYEVSDRGRVRVVRLLANGVERRHLLRQAKNHRGYMRVMLYRKGGRKHARVHMLVAAAFIGPAPFAGATVDHQDTNKRNNRADNLEWVTRLENFRRHLRRTREALEDVLDLFAAPVRQAAAR